MPKFWKKFFVKSNISRSLSVIFDKKKYMYVFRFIFAFLLFSSVLHYSQVRIVVKNAENKNIISNAEISCDGKIIGNTNSAGILEFSTKCKSIEIAASGFYRDDALVEKNMEVFLTRIDPKMQNIQTIILDDKSDPKALAILDKVLEKYPENSPKSLDSYSYKSYEKISMDIDEDSIQYYDQSIRNNMLMMKALFGKPKKLPDSSVKIKDVFADSQLFLWERAQEFLFSKKYGEKVHVLDNRISGLEKPIYEMMAFQTNRNEIPRQIQKQNRALYRYYLTDSVEVDGRENYVIRFRESGLKKENLRNKFNGFLYVDTETFGIKKIESESIRENGGNIMSTWIYYGGKWFLYSESAKVKIADMQKKEDSEKTDAEKPAEKKKTKKEDEQPEQFRTYGFVTTQYFDFKTPIEENPEDFRGYTFDVLNADGSKLNEYRTEPLTAREANTYGKIDSLAQSFPVERRAALLTALTRGKYRQGNVDFDLGQVITYNQYEGIRLGIAAKLNEKFNPYISPDAYVAYGFKDGNIKYGAGIDFKTTLQKVSFFRAEYFNNVLAAGRFSQNFWSFPMKIMNGGINLHNSNFYHFEGAKISFENDLSNSLSMNVSAKRQNEEVRFNYDFNSLGNQFQNFAVAVALKYSPFTKNIMTPAGKFSTEKKLPDFFFNAEQGIKSLGGDLSYTRLDFLAVHQLKGKLGTTSARLFGGATFGDVPIWHHFTMNGLSGGGNFNFNLTSYLGFATMKGGKYYNDRFAGLYLAHRIPWYFKISKNRTSSFDLIHRSVIGNMKNPEQHHFEFQKLDHLYQEVGLEWNNVLLRFFDFGVFYRVGYYSTSKFSDNFDVKLKLNLLEF